jgi:hypothetical protein
LSIQQGVVSKVLDRKFGNRTFYSMALRGVDGFFGTGAKRPPSEGSYVRFNSTTNAKGYPEVDGLIEVVPEGEAGPASSVSQVAQSSKGSGGLSKDQYWSNKEARDIVNDRLREVGASRNTAISLIDLAIRNEVIKLPAAAKREGFIWELLDKYTNKLMGKEVVENTPTEKGYDVVKEAAGPDVGDGDNWN